MSLTCPKLTSVGLSIVGPIDYTRWHNNILHKILFQSYFLLSNKEKNRAKPMYRSRVISSHLLSNYKLCTCFWCVFALYIFASFFFSSCLIPIWSRVLLFHWLIVLYIRFGSRAGEATVIQGKSLIPRFFLPFFLLWNSNSVNMRSDLLFWNFRSSFF